MRDFKKEIEKVEAAIAGLDKTRKELMCEQLKFKSGWEIGDRITRPRADGIFELSGMSCRWGAHWMARKVLKNGALHKTPTEIYHFEGWTKV